MIKKIALVLVAFFALSSLFIPAANAQVKSTAKPLMNIPQKPSLVAELTDSTFSSSVESSKGYVFVDFWAPWCGPCRKQSPVIDKVAEKFKGKIKFYKLNVDQARLTAPKFKIKGIPTMIIFKDGKEFSRIVGYRDEQTLASILSDLK